MTAASAVQFFIWLMIAASAIAIVAERLRIPYTVALVLGGLLIGSLRLSSLDAFGQNSHTNWLAPDVILLVFLPPLLFEASLRINFRELRAELVPILLLANVGVFVATLFTGYMLHWTVKLPLLIAFLFGAIISATDPVSVLSVFKEVNVNKRLTLLVDAESLMNDGAASVLFQLLLAGILAGNNIHVPTGIVGFLLSVTGGTFVGLVLGYVASLITSRIDDPQIEITLTAIVAYSSYLIAHHLHLSEVLATVVAGITFGNLGVKTGMSERTLVALWAFWDYAAFVINSLVFLLIGMEVRSMDIVRDYRNILLAVVAVLLARMLCVYSLSPVSNLAAENIPLRWQHVLVWGGLHGALSLALALSLPLSFPYREQILVFTFGVVAFSIVIQGLTIAPLIRVLKIATRER